MKTFKDEQNKKHSRFSNSIRNICLTLICSFILCSNSVYANTINTDVGQGTYDSIIVNNDGTIDHVATTNFRGIIGNIVSFLQRINRNEYQNGTYLATIYTYLSNNLPGQWQTLSDIKTSTTNSAASLNALLTLTGDQVNINWTDVSQFQGVSLTYGGTFVDRSHNYPTWEVSDLYWYFDNFNVAGQNFFRVQLPTRSSAQNRLNSYVDYIEVIGSNGQPVQADYTLEYDYMSNRLIIYFLNYVPFVQNYPFIIHIHYLYPISYFVNQDHKISYLPYDTTDYIMKSNNLYLRALLEKDITVDVPDVNVEINDSINVTPINLDVQIGIDDFTQVNTISNRLRTWLSTGVGVVDLIAALDELDDSFFTLHNRSVIETISTGYTDYYD